MDLSKNHREALLARLEAALEKKADLKQRLDSEPAKESLSFCEHVEIDDFLNNKEIELLRESLVDVEIDY